MLTTQEREFMDLYVRASFMHDYDSYAMTLTKSLGITYDHFARMYPFYHETWKATGEWPDAFPPIPEDPEPPCPWPNKEAMEARLDELETGPLSHLTDRKMRDWMLRSPLSRRTAVMSESNTSGRLEPETVQAAISDIRASHPSP
jgi:hypothetical protein